MKAQPQGQGTKTWPNDESKPNAYKSYKGAWVNGKMEGHGELIMSQGESYVGEFSNGYPVGQGTRKWANGDVYQGTFKNGFQSG